jgi:hypothetical protein
VFHTGKVWLDRNLGARQVCTSSTDAACFGDLYQWGRAKDGHESGTLKPAGQMSLAPPFAQASIRLAPLLSMLVQSAIERVARLALLALAPTCGVVLLKGWMVAV